VEVLLDHAPPSLASREPPEIEVSIGGEGADAVQEVRLRYRQGDESTYTTVVMQVEEGVARSRLPLLETREAYAVEYLVQALAPSGTALASQGSEADPLSVSVPAAPAGTSSGGYLDAELGGRAEDDDEGGANLTWLWVTLGVLAVAGGVTAAVLVTTSSGGPDDGSLGNIELPLRF
jgi:hypothetical protein